MNWVPEKYRINDRSELIAFKTDKFKTSILKVSMVAPSSMSEENVAMFSLMINILRSGTEKYPEKEDIIKRLNDLCDASCSIGGYAAGDNRILEISSEMLDERFSTDESIIDGVIEVMSQMLLFPRMDDDGLFRDEAVEREKKVVCDKIKSEKNNSRDYAIRKCREIMCADEPYGQMTEPVAILGISRKKLTDFYKSFLREARLTVSYVGALSGETVAEKMGRIFFGEPCGGAVTISPLVSHGAHPSRELEEELPVKQSVLVIGLRTDTLLGDKDSHVMPVLNNVFGGTYMSRLFKTLREKMSLCYYCSSDYASTKAVMYVSCGIDSVNYESARDEIFKQLERLKTESVDAEELKIAKELAIKELQEIRDYPSAIATFFYSRYIYGVEETLESLTKKIESVTADDIRRVAIKIVPDTVFLLKGMKNGDDLDGEDFDE